MKNEALLEVNRLHVSAGEKEILHGVDLTVGRDETHVLMGPNGTGKSTLGYAVTGNPVYTVTSGSIVFDGEDITALPVNERAKRGIFLSFQNPLEVPGVTLSAFIRSALEQKTGDRLRLWDFKKRLKETMRLLSMDESYAERDLNVGFSGGEKKKAEILQMLMLEPKLAILDETDSGLDVDAVRTVSEGVRLAPHHHALHAHSGGAARRRRARHGKRRHCQKGRGRAGRGHQRKGLRQPEDGVRR